jgi:hypothetical protein
MRHAGNVKCPHVSKTHGGIVIENNKPKQSRKGRTNNPHGRPKGTPNKTTIEFRETVRSLLEDNAENVGKWLSAVADGDPTTDVKPDPGKALDLMAKLAEFAAPKLARTEVVGDKTAPQHHVIKWQDD